LFLMYLIGDRFFLIKIRSTETRNYASFYKLQFEIQVISTLHQNLPGQSLDSWTR